MHILKVVISIFYSAAMSYVIALVPHPHSTSPFEAQFLFDVGDTEIRPRPRNHGNSAHAEQGRLEMYVNHEDS